MVEHHHHHHQAADGDEAAMAELLDLDAEVLPGYLREVTSWVRGWAPESSGRVLDLGAGTGTGTLALAPLFVDAELIAVDGSPDLLARLEAKAAAAGMSDRLRTIVADLDAAWPAIEAVDVVWTSLFLHHLADADRALREVHDRLRPGGVFAVIEMDAMPRFLPDDLGLGRPGLEARCHAALAPGRHEDMPDLGSDWRPRLESAGFEVVDECAFAIDPERPYPPSAGRYASLFLRRLRDALGNGESGNGELDVDDLATLDALLSSPGLLDEHLAIRGERRGWLARRP